MDSREVNGSRDLLLGIESSPADQERSHPTDQRGPSDFYAESIEEPVSIDASAQLRKRFKKVLSFLYVPDVVGS